jgi:CsoR family transcriptional regulator, copper-sensing transcriptional repressor
LNVSSEAPAYGYLAEKQALIKRLRRIEGQVRGIERMVDEERYCIDILTQLSAISSALDAVALKLLGDHVQSCVAGALASGDRAAADQKTRELLEAVERFTKGR